MPLQRLWRITVAISDVLSPYLPMGQISSTEEGSYQRQSLFSLRDSKPEKKFNAPPGRHMFVVGRTNMGKTTFVKAVINKKLENFPYYNVYHLDTKHLGDFDDRDGTVIRSWEPPNVFTTPGNRMVWQPTEDNKGNYSRFFMDILSAGIPAIVDIDETKNMVFGKIDNIPRGLGLLLYQGRLPGINVYGGTQEVYQSPRAMFSQAADVISFDVDNSYDEEMMLRYLRLKEEGLKHLDLRPHEFWHRDKDSGAKARKFMSYHDFLSMIK